MYTAELSQEVSHRSVATCKLGLYNGQDIAMIAGAQGMFPPLILDRHDRLK